jgi:serine/threonine protein kinase
MLDGRYLVKDLLGMGGMGRVYRAEHTGIGRAVAIKVLHRDLGNSKEAAQRFQREALASGRLDHPNIVGVSDSGVLQDGCPYLVMEVLEGEELGKRLEREKRIPWPEAIEIMRGVLAGLRHAHDKSVVHRDIKPDNIFLARKDGEIVVKILDFGIAKLVAGGANGDDPATTRAGLTVGTPAYLSPEQAVGGEIKPATDLYSMSVVFYEMLAGRPPFEDTDPLAIMTAHVSRNPPTFAEVVPDLQLPAGLEQVVRDGLEKVSAERTQTANAYLARLDEVMREAGYAVPVARGTQAGIMATPTPPPGTLHMPTTSATPGQPFPVRAATATTATTEARITHVHEPIPRKWLVIAGLVFITAIVIAIALKISGGRAPEPARPDPKPAKRDKHTELETPAPAQARAPLAVPVSAPGDRDKQLKTALLELESSATCTDRKAAIAELVALGDPRAVAPLKAARYRMRGGVLGIGDNNSNACLKAEAEAAIKALGGTLK